LDTRHFPVEQVLWEEATAFCGNLSERDGKRRFSLPTEAEWEYACRAGTMTPFHFGASLNGDKANFDGNFPYGTTRKGLFLQKPCRVGSYAANAFGLHDMHGNVWEWCADRYEKDYYHKRDKKYLKISQKSGTHVFRGGSWAGDARSCRSAQRDWGAPGVRYGSVGFRVAFRPD
jgi:formylglycine-generating enzyme required for sulfatase activity